MRKIIVLLLVIPLLGCTSKYRSEAVSRWNDSRLCVKYLTMPSINIWVDEVNAEVANRGLDCSKYNALAAAKIKADAIRDSSRGPIFRPSSADRWVNEPMTYGSAYPSRV